jgi:hypothetical protein
LRSRARRSLREPGCIQPAACFDLLAVDLYPTGIWIEFPGVSTRQHLKRSLCVAFEVDTVKFEKAFKKINGLTPTVYRRLHL